MYQNYGQPPLSRESLYYYNQQQQQYQQQVPDNRAGYYTNSPLARQQVTPQVQSIASSNSQKSKKPNRYSRYNKSTQRSNSASSATTVTPENIVNNVNSRYHNYPQQKDQQINYYQPDRNYEIGGTGLISYVNSSPSINNHDDNETVKDLKVESPRSKSSIPSSLPPPSKAKLTGTKKDQPINDTESKNITIQNSINNRTILTSTKEEEEEAVDDDNEKHQLELIKDLDKVEDQDKNKVNEEDKNKNELESSETIIPKSEDMAPKPKSKLEDKRKRRSLLLNSLAMSNSNDYSFSNSNSILSPPIQNQNRSRSSERFVDINHKHTDSDTFSLRSLSQSRTRLLDEESGLAKLNILQKGNISSLSLNSDSRTISKVLSDSDLQNSSNQPDSLTESAISNNNDISGATVGPEGILQRTLINRMSTMSSSTTDRSSIISKGSQKSNDSFGSGSGRLFSTCSTDTTGTDLTFVDDNETRNDSNNDNNISNDNCSISDNNNIINNISNRDYYTKLHEKQNRILELKSKLREAEEDLKYFERINKPHSSLNLQAPPKTLLDAHKKHFSSPLETFQSTFKNMVSGGFKNNTIEKEVDMTADDNKHQSLLSVSSTRSTPALKPVTPTGNLFYTVSPIVSPTYRSHTFSGTTTKNSKIGNPRHGIDFTNTLLASGTTSSKKPEF